MLKTDQALKQFANGSHTHAYLLLGHRGQAEKIAAEVKERLKISVADYHLLQGEGAVPIAAVRALKATLGLKPHSSSHHLVFAPAAHTMTSEAQNALLKILEEPPAPTVFLLSCPDERLLLPTVASRCQPVRLESDSAALAVPAELLDVSAQTLPALFRLAESLAKDEHLTDLLDGWIIALRQSLRKGDRAVARSIRKILATKETIIQTQANRRLLLENLFLTIKFPKEGR